MYHDEKTAGEPFVAPSPELWQRLLLRGADILERRGLAKRTTINLTGAVCLRGALLIAALIESNLVTEAEEVDSVVDYLHPATLRFASQDLSLIPTVGIARLVCLQWPCAFYYYQKPPLELQQVFDFPMVEILRKASEKVGDLLDGTGFDEVSWNNCSATTAVLVAALMRKAAKVECNVS